MRTTLADGSRTILMRDLAQDGDTDATAGHAITTDADGNGSTDTSEATVLTLDASGNSTSTRVISNGDGSLRFKTYYEQTADALSVTQKFDHNGDGTYDVVTSDVTTFNGGERIENLVVSNEDGSIQLKQKTVLAADKVAGETWRLVA